MAAREGSIRLLGRERGLDDQIGDAERARDRRPEPVRRLVVEVIGEPGCRPLVRQAPRDSAAAAALPGGAPSACEPLLADRVAGAIVAPQPAGQLDLVPARARERRKSARAMRRSPDGIGWSGGFIGA